MKSKVDKKGKEIFGTKNSGTADKCDQMGQDRQEKT